MRYYTMKKIKEKKVKIDPSQKKKLNRSLGARNKQRGNAYEVKIAKELRDIGFTGVVTSREESKKADDNKIDLIDTENKLPCNIQLKRTISTPQYFNIRKETTVCPKTFVVMWNKQRNVNGRFMSDGEMVMMDKEFFYELIKVYANA